jgi:hypothetical protein
MRRADLFWEMTVPSPPATMTGRVSSNMQEPASGIAHFDGWFLSLQLRDHADYGHEKLLQLIFVNIVD